MRKDLHALHSKLDKLILAQFPAKQVHSISGTTLVQNQEGEEPQIERVPPNNKKTIYGHMAYQAPASYKIAPHGYPKQGFPPGFPPMPYHTPPREGLVEYSDIPATNSIEPEHNTEPELDRASEPEAPQDKPELDRVSPQVDKASFSQPPKPVGKQKDTPSGPPPYKPPLPFPGRLFPPYQKFLKDAVQQRTKEVQGTVVLTRIKTTSYCELATNRSHKVLSENTSSSCSTPTTTRLCTCSSLVGFTNCENLRQSKPAIKYLSQTRNKLKTYPVVERKTALSRISARTAQSGWPRNACSALGQNRSVRLKSRPKFKPFGRSRITTRETKSRGRPRHNRHATQREPGNKASRPRNLRVPRPMHPSEPGKNVPRPAEKPSAKSSPPTKPADRETSGHDRSDSPKTRLSGRPSRPTVRTPRSTRSRF
ncbi:unnamed protein product [Microthlaspi erraticum]|uniref:Uncharacterized protein n=1 Tax=Microthlaspi erraticum TaxID=1685480 RepID=A0A6D2IAP6_9BRAS|nr:unnamed protein product [Microthlaspi erraticum]